MPETTPPNHADAGLEVRTYYVRSRNALLARADDAIKAARTADRVRVLVASLNGTGPNVNMGADADIDTLALTRVLRSAGVMRGVIATGQVDPVALVDFFTRATAAGSGSASLDTRGRYKTEAQAKEAIELLLQTRRANPRSGGGGGGSSPGGGGSGSTDQAALEHFGPDADAAAVVQERGVQQTTGNTSEDIPTEYREGIDAFFNAIDGR